MNPAPSAFRQQLLAAVQAPAAQPAKANSVFTVRFDFGSTRVSIPGVYGGFLDKFPMGAAFGKAVFPWAASGRAIANGRDEGVTCSGYSS